MRQHGETEEKMMGRLGERKRRNELSQALTCGSSPVHEECGLYSLSKCCEEEISRKKYYSRMAQRKNRGFYGIHQIIRRKPVGKSRTK